MAAVTGGGPSPRLVLPALVLVLAVASLGCAGPRARGGLAVSPEVPDTLASLLERMPAESVERENRLMAELVALGPDAARRLTAMIGSPAADDDLAARYALSGLARWVTRRGAEAERAELAAALAGALAEARDGEAKRFVLEQLALMGGPESVPEVALLLGDAELAADAARALQAIGGAGAQDAVVRALRRQGQAPSPDLLLAAGALEARAARPPLRRALLGDDPVLRGAAARALVTLATPGVGRDLATAMEGAVPEEQRRLAFDLLAYAVRRAHAGATARAISLAWIVLDHAAASADEPLQIAALATLAEIAPAVALAELDLLEDPSPRLAGEAARLRAEIEASARGAEVRADERAEGFVPLFNGTDLSGWTGATDGYFVAGGAIVCDPDRGGNLYTEGEYGDFVLRFEFRLTPGANNGLGIRAPLQGDAAYAGIELQILDDGALQHADLRPYQYHGSIYGVAAAERGHQRPVGQWNEQEVVAQGRRIRVTLNGAAILDVDLDEVARPRTADGRDHPGLERAQGHIGFLGHGSRVEFRNIRLRELDGS